MLAESQAAMVKASIVAAWKRVMSGDGTAFPVDYGVVYLADQLAQARKKPVYDLMEMIEDKAFAWMPAIPPSTGESQP